MHLLGRLNPAFLPGDEDARGGEEARAIENGKPAWSVSPTRLRYLCFSFIFSVLVCFNEHFPHGVFDRTLAEKK